MTTDVLNKKKQLFDRWAPNYDFLLVSVFYQAVHKRLLEYVDLSGQANILDLGCGTGRLLNRLATQFPQICGTGLDLSSEMLRQARQSNYHHPRLIYVQGNAESLPFAHGQFDAVFNTISFLHYQKPEQVFSEVSRVLCSGGCFYLVDSIPGNLSANRGHGSFPYIGEIKLYNQQARERLGVQAGLDCLDHCYLLGPVLLTIFTKPCV